MIQVRRCWLVGQKPSSIGYSDSVSVVKHFVAARQFFPARNIPDRVVVSDHASDIVASSWPTRPSTAGNVANAMPPSDSGKQYQLAVPPRS